MSKQSNDTYIQLFLWSHSHFDKKDLDYSKYTKYETEPQSALKDVWTIAENPTPFSDNISNLLVYISSVLLVDFINQISQETIQDCADVIIQHLIQILDKQGVCVAGDGTERCV